MQENGKLPRIVLSSYTMNKNVVQQVAKSEKHQNKAQGT